MADGSNEGANIAVKAGDGAANIFHWEGVQKTINDLYTRDLYHQKRVQDEYIKSQAQLATEAKGIRAADIPDFQKAYNNFRDASMKLMDRKVQNDPELRAYYTKQKDDSFVDGMSLRGLGDEVKKTIGSYKNNWVQNQGLNASDNYHENMNSIEGMSSKQIRATNADDVANFFTAKDDTPLDQNKAILGNAKIVEERQPVFDAKGQKMADQVSKYSIGSEYPLGVVANNALAHLKKYKGVTTAARNEFGAMPPDQAKTFIDNANMLIKQETPQAPPLPYDYVGYQAAKWVNQARTKVLTGDPETKYDALWMDNHNNQQQLGLKKMEFAHTDANQRKLFAHEDTRDANKAARAAKLFPEIDTKPVWDALKTNDRGKIMQYMGEIAKNNPDKTVPVTISRLDIADPSTVKGVLTSFGIDPDGVKYVKGDTPQKTIDNRVEAVVKKINEVSGGSKISVQDLNNGQVVAGLIHLGQVNEFDPDHPGTYKGTKQTRMPVLFNAKNSSPEQLQAEISQEYAKKKKQYLEQQDNAFDGISGTDNTPAAPAPAAHASSNSGKWAKYKRH